jgi:hypothetical protein
LLPDRSSLLFTHFILVNPRPLRSNRGKGGAIAQLQAVAKLICADTTKKTKTTNILEDVPLNAMAPVTVEKGCKDLYLFLFYNNTL